MNAYLDTSVLMRKVLAQGRELKEWKKIERGFISRIGELELHRTLDRLRLQGRLDDRQLGVARERAQTLFRGMTLVSVDDQLLRDAATPMPTVLATLDAIHLITARKLREQFNLTLQFATHDVQLALGARACSFSVIGA